MFEALEVLLTDAWLELMTTAVLDLLAVFAVELFAVVFAALPQAERSKTNEATLSVEKVRALVSFIFSLS